MTTTSVRPSTSAVWSPLVLSGVLRGVLTAAVFYNLITYFQYGSVLLGVTTLAGVLGNLLFLGVVGLICSLVTRTGTEAFRAYARTFVLPLVAYLLLLPVMVMLVPNLPPHVSFADAESARQVTGALRGSTAMQVFRSVQLSLFLAQAVWLYVLLRPHTTPARLCGALGLCLALYGTLFFTGVI